MDSVLGEITLIQVADLGKIKFMSLKVEGKNLVQFAGPNEAGKSTVLDRLQNLFESAAKVPDGIIRKGIYHKGQNAGKKIDRGMARIETSNGYVIEQIVRKTKNDEQRAELKVSHNGMPVQGGPLQFLKSVSSKYPDPHKVANMSGKELFAELWAILGIDLTEYDEAILAQKEIAKDARAQLKVLGAPKIKPEGEEPVDLPENFEALIDSERIAADIMNEEADKYRNLQDRFIKGNDLLAENVKKIDDLKTSIRNLEKAGENIANELVKITTAMETQTPILEESQATHKLLSEQSQNYHRISEAANLWKTYNTDVELRVQSNQLLEKCKTNIETIQEERDEAINNIDIPVTGLSIIEEGEVGRISGDEFYNWDTLSMAARLTAATELCINTIPEGALRALYIERGESLGEDYRKLIASLAASKDVQVFMEVFTEQMLTGDGVFMLEEGEVIDVQNTGEVEQPEKDAFIETPPNEMHPAPTEEPAIDIDPTGFKEPEEKLIIGVLDEEVDDLF